MKKMPALFLSFVLVFAFAGCSAEPSTPSDSSESSESSISSEPINCDVFRDINEKSKQLTYLNIDFDSVEISTISDLAKVSVEAENVTISVSYDKKEYEKKSENLKVLSVSAHAKKDVLSDEEKKEFLDVCKSILLIDEWGLTLDDLKDLKPEDGLSYIKTPDGNELSVIMVYDSSSIITISTKEIWNYY